VNHRQWISGEGQWTNLIIKLATVSYANDSYFPLRVVYFVSDPPVADPNAPYAFLGFNLQAACRARLKCERVNNRSDAAEQLAVKLIEVFACASVNKIV
jgi:hypothetical protein